MSLKESASTHIIIRRNDLINEREPFHFHLDDDISNQISESNSDHAHFDEFIELIYRCKICCLLAETKDSLIDHIKSLHLIEQNSSVGMECMDSEISLNNTIVESVDSKRDSNSSEQSEYHNTRFRRKTATNGKIARHEIFLCGKCNQGFRDIEGCSLHLRTIHKKDVDSCDGKVGVESKLQDDSMNLCDSEPVTQIEIEENSDATLQAKNKSKQSRCTFKDCSARLKPTCLEYHLSCHSSDLDETAASGPAFTCPVCGLKSEKWKRMRIHLWVYHHVDLDLESCSKCSFKTTSQFKLNKHIATHDKERPFSCSQCAKSFKLLKHLENHVLVHSKDIPVDPKDLDRYCKFCCRTFSDAKCLKHHIEFIHDKLKPFSCTQCSYKATTKALLSWHNRQHTGEKPFACDSCDYRSRDHNCLRRHKMRHSGIKKYQCPHCPYASIQTASYKTHMRTKHPGDYGLFVCSLCDFKTVQNDLYQHHLTGNHTKSELQALKAFQDTQKPIEITASIALTETEGMQLTLNEESIDRLQKVLPNSLDATQLLQSCLSALQSSNSGFEVSSQAQTINIQLPNSGVGSGKIRLTIVPAEGDTIDENSVGCADRLLSDLTLADDSNSVKCASTKIENAID